MSALARVDIAGDLPLSWQAFVAAMSAQPDTRGTTDG